MVTIQEMPPPSDRKLTLMDPRLKASAELERFFGYVELAWSVSLVMGASAVVLGSLGSVMSVWSWTAVFAINGSLRMWAITHSVEARFWTSIMSVFVFTLMVGGFILRTPFPGSLIYSLYAGYNVRNARLLWVLR